MAFLPIVTGPTNRILRGKSEQVTKFDKKLWKLLEDMKETMYKAEGVGLAAPQIGLNIRVVVCRFNHGTSHETVVEMVNPVITALSDAKLDGEEGCLSIPGKFDEVRRHKSVTVKFLDRKGRECVLKLNGFNARIVQHEVDHINSMLYIDRVGEM
jgi:peptide deformylase